MTTATTHPLSEARAAELWDAHRTEPGVLPLHAQGRLYIKAQVSMLRDAYDAGREHERDHADPHHDPRPWQDCTKDAALRAIITAVEEWQETPEANEDGRDMSPLAAALAGWEFRRTAPPAEEITLPTEHPAHITDVEDVDGDVCAYMALNSFGGWIGVDQDGDQRSWSPRAIVAFTLPDGTRARRDGEREDGTPRFVKVQEADQ